MAARKPSWSTALPQLICSIRILGARYAGAVPDSISNSMDGPPAPDYGEDGVDLTLIRWTLSLTPAERLRFLEERINEILTIRELNART